MKTTKNISLPHGLYTRWLLLGFLLFYFRVTAQLVQAIYPTRFLPAFEKWHSGALTYPSLVISQIIILLLMAIVIKGFARATTSPNRSIGLWVLTLGLLYFITMAFRLIVGLMFTPNHPWFGALIPAFFHLVLASFMILVGHFHLNGRLRLNESEGS